jgi:hypothetical protein
MRVSGERQRNSANASPENLASARKAGSPASRNTPTASTDSCDSSAA